MTSLPLDLIYNWPRLIRLPNKDDWASAEFEFGKDMDSMIDDLADEKLFPKFKQKTKKKKKEGLEKFIKQNSPQEWLAYFIKTMPELRPHWMLYFKREIAEIKMNEAPVCTQMLKETYLAISFQIESEIRKQFT